MTRNVSLHRNRGAEAMSTLVRARALKTLTLAVMMTGLGRGAGGALQNAKPTDNVQLHRDLSAQFSTWRNQNDKLATIQRSLPKGIDAKAGTLNFPDRMTVEWVFQLPTASLGA